MGEKGLSIEECVRRAQKYITKQGACLLLFDVKGFSDMSIYLRTKRFNKMVRDLNKTFSDYLPINSLAILTPEKGFRVGRGDSGLAGICSAEIIPKIVEYQKAKYPELPLYWSVAKDGWDDEGFKKIGI